jgi:hypothetical protein
VTGDVQLLRAVGRHGPCTAMMLWHRLEGDWPGSHASLMMRLDALQRRGLVVKDGRRRPGPMWMLTSRGRAAVDHPAAAGPGGTR